MPLGDRSEPLVLPVRPPVGRVTVPGCSGTRPPVRSVRGPLPSIRGTRPALCPTGGSFADHPSSDSKLLGVRDDPPVSRSRYLLGDRALPPSAKSEDPRDESGGPVGRNRRTGGTKPEDRRDGTGPLVSQHPFHEGMKPEDLSGKSLTQRFGLRPSPPRNRRHRVSEPADAWPASDGSGGERSQHSSAKPENRVPGAASCGTSTVPTVRLAPGFRAMKSKAFRISKSKRSPRPATRSSYHALASVSSKLAASRTSSTALGEAVVIVPLRIG